MTRLVPSHRCIPLLGLAALLLAFATPVSAADSDQAATATEATTAIATAPASAPVPTADPAAEADTAIDFSGMVVHIDPRTGRIRQPTPEEAAALSRAIARRMEIASLSAASHSEEHLANGAVMVELDPAFHDFTVGRRTADGTLVTDCVHGSDSARALTLVPAEAPATPEVK